MNRLIRLWPAIVLCLLFMDCGALAAKPVGHTGLKLSLKLDKAVPPDSVLVELVVRNAGKTNASLINPKARSIAFYGSWGGWTLTVSGKTGYWLPMAVPGAFVHPVPADRIVLGPGESCSSLINIGNWIRADQQSGEEVITLAQTPGKYAIQAEYATEENYFWWLENKTEDVSLTPIEGLRSKTCSFKIGRDLGVGKKPGKGR